MSRKKARPGTRAKYRKAEQLYAETDMTAKAICEQAGVSVSGFQRYIHTYRRDLLLRRNEVSVERGEEDRIRLRNGGTGQTLKGRRKYREAIAACSDERYIEYNISQIARLFSLDGTALGNQLRRHYPEIVPLRERERERRGLSDNIPRGARPNSVEQYAEAIAMLESTDKGIGTVAEECGVSFSGLKSHLLQYHGDVVLRREAVRKASRNSRRAGALNGNGRLNGPKASTVAQYREAVELYRTTLLPLSEVARRTQVSLNGLTYHLYRWHRPLVLERKGITPKNGERYDEYMDLSVTKHYRKSTEVKYAAAIGRLKEGKCGSVAEAAAEFGFNAETFRAYLKEHEPELNRRYGQTRLSNGRTVLSRSSEKYAEAVELYRTTAEPLKSIARRLGLVYNSLSGFIRRNIPEAAAQHARLLSAESEC